MLTSELGDDVQLQSWWAGERTSPVFYGADVERMRAVLTDAADRFPLAGDGVVEPIT